MSQRLSSLAGPKELDLPADTAQSEQMSTPTPPWLREARSATRLRDWVRAANMIRNHVFEDETTDDVRREAFELLDAITAKEKEAIRAREQELLLAYRASQERKLTTRIEDARRATEAAKRKADQAAELERRGRPVGEVLRQQARRAAEEARRTRLEAARGEAEASRARELVEAGLPRRRAEALAPMNPGPYEVELLGTEPGYDKPAICVALADLGYERNELTLALERAIHIAPEVIAYRLHQSEAVRIKIRLEAAGAKVRIR